MGLNCGASLIKYILFIVNLICAVGGIALVVIGAIALKNIGDIKDVLKNNEHPGIFAALIIALGSLVFVIAFFGCMGSLRESQCLLNLYALCLLAIVVLQVLLAVFVFIYNQDIQESVSKSWDGVWAGRQTVLNKKVIDQVQKSIECCGSETYLDYGTDYPASCCPSDSSFCTILTVYKTGCKTQVKNLISSSSINIAYLSLIMAAIELIAVVFSCCLSSNIRNSSRLTLQQHY